MADYITGTGQKLLRVHQRTELCDSGCVIHNPTDPRAHWKTNWRPDSRIMERMCPHGVGHPDKDSLAFILRTEGPNKALALATHGCDGCCKSL